MKRETITLMLNCVEDGFISETAVFRPASRQESPERTAHMKKKRIITAALAAALLLALGITAYAVWSIHSARQQELKADLKIEEKNVNSYTEYPVPSQSSASGVTLLSTVNDGEFQRVFVNVSPVKRDVIDRFPETVAFAWRLDGMTLNGEDYWMTAGPKLKSGTSVSGYEAIREAVYQDAYDEETETLTLECSISNDAIAQAQAYENSERVHLTLTLWDRQAQADANVGLSAEWLGSQEPFGSVWIAPTDQETRYFDFHQAFCRDEESDREIEIVGLELTPFSAVWKVRYDLVEQFHQPNADWDAYKPWSMLEDRVCIEAKLIFSDGSVFSTGGALNTPFENGIVNLNCGWESAININDVQRIVLGDLVLWEAE